MLTCRVIDRLTDLTPLADAWDGLLARGGFNDIFGTAGCTRAWWRAYGEGKRPFVVVVESSSGELRLVAPLVMEPGSDHLQIMGGVGTDYSQLIHDKDDRDSVRCFFEFMRTRRDWRTFEARCIPLPSQLVEYFFPNGSAATPRRRVGPMAASLELRQVHPIIGRERLEAFGGLLQQESHRKHVNWFSRRGSLTYSCVTKPSEIKAALPELVRLHKAEWDQRGDPSQFAETRHQEFYENLIEELAPTGAVRLDLLALNDRIIAAHFGFTWAGRVYYYKPAFDPEFGSHSPGKLLFAHIIRDSVAQEVREIDMLFGLEPYKLKYSSELRTTALMRIWRSWTHPWMDEMKARLRKLAPPALTR